MKSYNYLVLFDDVTVVDRERVTVVDLDGVTVVDNVRYLVDGTPVQDRVTLTVFVAGIDDAKGERDLVQGNVVGLPEMDLVIVVVRVNG